LLIFPNVAILSLLLNKDILTPLNPDAHEALSIENFVMARYGSKNQVILIK